MKIYPGGQSNFRKEVQFRIASAGAWDPSNDWSFAGVASTPGSTPVKVTRIPVYDNGVRVFGTEPGGGDTQPPSTPANLRVTATTSTTVGLAWNAATDNVGVTGYQLFRGTTLVTTAAGLTFTDTGLTPSTTYGYTVRAVDAAGNQSAASTPVSATTGAPVPDTQAPTAPANLAVASKTSSTVSLAWTGSTDNVGVTGYRVLEGTTQVGTSTAASFTVTGLAASSTHTYTVRAVDAAANVSAASNAVTVTTDAVSASSLKVQYRAADASATDQQIKPHLTIVNTGTTAVPLSELTVRYWYTRDGTQPQAYDCDFALVGCANVTATFVTLSAPVATADVYLQLAFGAGAGALSPGAQTGEMQNRIHNQNWTSFNEANDYSYDGTKTAFADWNRVTLYRNGALVWGTEPTVTAPDTQAPTAPGGLVSTGQTSTTIALSWTGSTDNVGVAGYRVREGATVVGTPTGTALTVTALAPSTAHTYTVVAFDAAGNVSPSSNAVTVSTTAATDTTPPTAPAGLVSTGQTTTTIALAWTGSTDNVGVTGYRVREGTAVVGTPAGTSFTVTGLAAGTAHTYTVVAFDAAGNLSPSSNAVTASTTTAPDTTPPTAPAGLAVAAKTSTTVSLAWTASTDNVGVTGYRVREGTAQVAASTTPSATVTGLAPSSTHAYTVVAVDAAGNLSAASSALTVTTDPAAPSTLKVQYRAGDTSATDQQIKPHLTIVNAGTTAVPLSELTARYWYTRDGTQPQAYDCDHAVVGCANVAATFAVLPTPVPAADAYLQLGFGPGAGMLQPGAQTGEIQNRVHNQNWTSFNEANDYSYDGTKTAFADWNRVTLYRNGVLVWGTEPTPAGPDFTLGATPSTVGVAQAGTATSTIGITRLNGFTGGVTFSATGVPAGVSAAFSPATATGAASTLTFTATTGAATGAATVTVAGTSGASTRTTTIALTVTATQTPDFAVSVTPATVVVPQGGSTPAAVTVTRVGGFSGNVTFAAAGLSSGVTATFAPASTPGTSATVTFTASATAAAASATVTVSGTSGASTRTTPLTLTVTVPQPNNAYLQRFRDIRDELHGTSANNGYFHPANVPYHSVETLICEAPDHGHETTSETFSYWAWLEAMHGNLTGDWTPLQQVFTSMEANIIPTQADQPTNSFYNAADPADYAPEADLPSGYPSVISSGTPVGTDPIAAELRTTYNTPDVYGMHWILDVDNFYGYGRRGDGTSQPSYINTFQRGPQESVWETVPQPSWEDFQWGSGTNGGYLPLFITGPTPARQWRYTNAPDADARLIQAMYWAKTFADARGGSPAVDALAGKAGMMGDYLRYAMFDKYFKTMGCTSPGCPAGTGYNAAHYLMSWYYAWGGAIDASAGWAWRIGSSHNHAGYQNPMAAHALTTVPALRPRSANGVRDWTTSLSRQLEFYRWLQSADGAIAGGATNSWGGRYAAPPAGVSTFYGMFYQENPVYVDPGSNTWFGFQAWSLERVAEYYYVTGDSRAKLIMDKWVTWAMANTRLLANGSYEVPSTLDWDGQPSLNWTATAQNWNAADTTYNAALRATVVDRTQDVGVAAAYAKTLVYYSAAASRWATPHPASRTLAKEILDRMWTLYRDELGVAVPETRLDYARFDDPVFVPPGFSGVMPNGDAIGAASTFIGLRSDYRSDPAWPQVQAYLDGGAAPTFTYHRFWAQVDVALANAEYGRLFPND